MAVQRTPGDAAVVAAAASSRASRVTKNTRSPSAVSSTAVGACVVQDGEQELAIRVGSRGPASWISSAG